MYISNSEDTATTHYITLLCYLHIALFSSSQKMLVPSESLEFGNTFGNAL